VQPRKWMQFHIQQTDIAISNTFGREESTDFCCSLILYTLPTFYGRLLVLVQNDVGFECEAAHFTPTTSDAVVS
jgi:hypothetical protein